MKPYLVTDNMTDDAVNEMFTARFAPLHACFDRLDAAMAKRLEPCRERVVALDARREQDADIDAAFLELFKYLKSDRAVLELLTGDRASELVDRITELLDHWHDDHWHGWDDDE